MIRNNKPDAILTADWHLRENKPICRTDNFWLAQWKKVKFIKDLQKEFDCDVFHAGDLFDHWKPSPFLLSTTIRYLPKRFFTIYGNHDLPQHNLELQNKSGIYTLQKAGIISVIEPKDVEFIHWNMIPFGKDEAEILIWHIMTYDKNLPFPGAKNPAISLLKKYPQYKLILTGDNHQSFTVCYKNRWLVNPGSLTRQKADQINYIPKVYLWYKSSNEVKELVLPFEKDVISNDHLIQSKDRDSRIDAFISKLKDDWKATISFEDNIRIFEEKNKIRDSVMNIIYKSIEL